MFEAEETVCWTTSRTRIKAEGMSCDGPTSVDHWWENLLYSPSCAFSNLCFDVYASRAVMDACTLHLAGHQLKSSGQKGQVWWQCSPWCKIDSGEQAGVNLWEQGSDSCRLYDCG